LTIAGCFFPLAAFFATGFLAFDFKTGFLATFLVFFFVFVFAFFFMMFFLFLVLDF